jgi:serine/threonine-protein kinase
MQIRAERSIRVVVSKGGQSVFVPSVVGRRLAEAQSAIASEGLQMGAVDEVYSTSFDEKVVVTQDPSSGTVVARGALVDVSVSKGLPPSGAPIVPDFKQQNVDNARDWAKGVNATLNVKEDAKAVGVSGTVVKQDPPAGQPLLVGDSLDVTIVPLIASEKGARLSYKMPAGSGSAQLRILARDNRGESEIYNGTHKAGENVEIPMNVNSTTRVRIYVDGLLKEERVVEP